MCLVLCALSQAIAVLGNLSAYFEGIVGYAAVTIATPLITTILGAFTNKQRPYESCENDAC